VELNADFLMILLYVKRFCSLGIKIINKITKSNKHLQSAFNVALIPYNKTFLYKVEKAVG
jgi:hypothetical protein